MATSGIIDVGGGMRGIYAAGVFDRCLDDGVTADLAIGISAGSANVASYVAGQLGRNYRYYAAYSFRKAYMSWQNFLTKRSFIDLDYVYSTLSDSDGEDPLDYEAFAASPTDVIVVAANADTGETKYFPKSAIQQDDYDVLKASCALPVACRPYVIDGVPYYDGALGDTVPIQKALDEGCERVVLVLTKPQDVPRSPKNDQTLAKLLRRSRPEAADRLATRADRYNEGVAFAKELESQGRALIVAPDDTCGVSTLTRDRASFDALYAKGYRDGGAVAPFLA